MHFECIDCLDLCINMSNAKFEVFVSSRNLGSEGYVTKQGCLNGIASVKANAPYDSRYERKDSFQNYTFNLKASNGEIIGRSENYTSSSGRENGIAAVKRDAPVARIVDLT